MVALKPIHKKVSTFLHAKKKQKKRRVGKLRVSEQEEEKVSTEVPESRTPTTMSSP